MTRSVLLGSVLLAACGSGAANAPVSTTTELGTSVHATRSTGATSPGGTADPSFAFRRAYVDPGGMWMPSQMLLPLHEGTLAKMGVTMDPKALANPLAAPLAAVVYLGGCTGSFVSKDGLIVTNHHCVERALQYNSDAKHDYVKDGFLAKTMGDEPSTGPAVRVEVLQAVRDVTHDIMDGLDAIQDPVAREQEAQKREKALLATCEKGRPAIHCNVAKFFGGHLYELTEMLELRDVRLVYAPERSIGDYGGEVDNWGWPRHTGDWSFLRAYVGRDGEPATYAEDNVPYRPAHYLKVSTDGLHAADFVMVAGYPAFTNRLETASEVHHDLEWYYPYRIAYLKDRYAIDEAHASDPGETGIKATVSEEYTQNALAKYQGILDGFQHDPSLLARKDELDRKVKEWAAQPGHETSKQAIGRLEGVLEDMRKTARVDFDRRAVLADSRLLASALEMVRWAVERGKPDAARRPGFQDRDLPRALAAQEQLAKQYDATLDRAYLRLALVRALQLPEPDRGWLADLLGAHKGDKLDEAFVDRTLDAWYKNPPLTDTELRVALVGKGTLHQLRASKDPFIRAALRIWPTVVAEDKRDDTRAGELLIDRPAYVEAVLQVAGGALAPDANSTLRITYGTVRSLRPGSKNPADWPFTVAAQLLAKNTGKAPFDAPPKELEAFREKLFGPFGDPALGGELPLDFESDLDITGGNSGSPTLNAKGELVGLAFDSNKLGLASDVVFDGTKSRTIHVDARYMVWAMHVIDHADRLLEEMGVSPKMP